MRKIIIIALLLISIPLTAKAQDKESAYERVMRTNTIKCGYVTYDPVVIKDPITGDVKGIAVDLMDKIAKELSLKVEWTTEISYVTGFEGLKQGRYDLVCTALWGVPSQTRVGELIGPAYYYPMGTWVRADDTRFDKDLSLINDENFTISGVDGTYPLDAAKKEFPKATVLSLPQTSDYVQPMMDVMTKKADVTFMDNNIGLRFLEKNPGTLKNLTFDPPFKIFGQYFMVNRGEFELRSMLHHTLEYLIMSGEVDKILEQYEAKEGAGYYRRAKPYEAKQ